MDRDNEPYKRFIKREYQEKPVGGVAEGHAEKDAASRKSMAS